MNFPVLVYLMPNQTMFLRYVTNDSEYNTTSQIFEFEYPEDLLKSSKVYSIWHGYDILHNLQQAYVATCIDSLDEFEDFEKQYGTERFVKVRI